MNLTDDERRERASLLLELNGARVRMEAAYQRFNDAVSAAYAAAQPEVEAHNATLARAVAFLRRVAVARVDFEGPRAYEAERTRDMGETWEAAADEIAHLTAALDPVREYSFVGDGEADPREVMLDLPTEAR